MVRVTALYGSAEMKSRLEAHKASENDEALAYLREKFPGVEEAAFYTDYRGNVSNHVSEAHSVIKAAMTERTCARCGGKCTLPGRSGKPVVSIEESPGGFK